MMVNELKPVNFSKGVFYVAGIQKPKDRINIYIIQEKEFAKSEQNSSHSEKIYKSIVPKFWEWINQKRIVWMLFADSASIPLTKLE
jgi:hypothetical protein